MTAESAHRRKEQRDLRRFLISAGAGVVVSSILVIVLKGGLLWSVLIVLLSGCAGGLIGAVQRPER